MQYPALLPLLLLLPFAVTNPTPQESTGESSPSPNDQASNPPATDENPADVGSIDTTLVATGGYPFFPGDSDRDVEICIGNMWALCCNGPFTQGQGSYKTVGGCKSIKQTEDCNYPAHNYWDGPEILCCTKWLWKGSKAGQDCEVNFPPDTGIDPSTTNH